MASGAGLPLLLVVGSGREMWRGYMFEELVSEYRVHLLCGSPPTWESRFLWGHAVVDTTDAEAMVAVARAGPEPYAGVLTWLETRVEQAALVAAALGLVTSPVDALHACRDKYAGRRRLAAAGVGQAVSVAVAGLGAAYEAAERIGYPVVVKPRALAGSNGVSLVPTAAELGAAFEQAGALWFDDVPAYDEPVLVEEFLDGPEISVDSVCQGGRVSAVFVARKELGYPPGFEETGHVVRGDDPLLGDAALLRTLQDAHAALGLTDGATHSELRLTAAGPRVVEINARVGGGRIPYLGTLATGIRFGLAAAAVAAGRRPDLTPSRCRTAGIRFLYPGHDMRVTAASVDRARIPPDVRVEVFAAPGQRLLLPPRSHWWGRSGFAMAVADDEKACTAALDQAAAAVTIDGTPLP